ncbi:LCP family protein [Fictibacillus phosphorivorans]|uniref:LCP family glycopolymer transferase n=1 Tax=Fictibacillus phosphorivorans TaxID=1221500 RepID=UPI00203D8ED1|nr:LCP family protein [Fictibacillus phosphorivorans]MCM3717713.1 LCP family protein [Fictibacillus phosphorivorans]MCM3775613.1 LCP family protein [Fictibacillus phosphorivorans]
MTKFLKIVAIVLGLAVVGVGGYLYYLYDSAKDAAHEMHEKIEVDKPKPIITGKEEDLKPISIMLLGVDEREGDSGRSDTIVIIAVDPKDDKMLMFNIPRDTRTEIIGKGKDDKINHAYAFGGTQMAMDTVENFLDTPIDYYVKVNMESFKQIVNAVGGVEVNNPFAFKAENYSFPKGKQELNGDEALAYSRMRYEDPQGDRGRNNRQRQVITSIINKGARVSSILKIDNILEILGDNVKTNMTFDEMKYIQKNYKSARRNIKSTEVKSSGTMIGGTYYGIVDDAEKERLHQLLNEYLSE